MKFGSAKFRPPTIPRISAKKIGSKQVLTTFKGSKPKCLEIGHFADFLKEAFLTEF